MKIHKLLTILILVALTFSYQHLLAEIPGVEWPIWDNATPLPHVVSSEPISNIHEPRKQRVQIHRSFAGRFIEPLGITTLALLVLTGTSGMFRRKLPKKLVRSHKRLGIITVIFALIHATLVIIAH